MLLLNRYSYNPQIDFIADGGHSKVYKASDTQQDNLPVVIKFYYNITTDLFKENMERIKSLAHPHLVKLYDYIEIESINAFGQSDTLRLGIWEYVAGAKSSIDTKLASNIEQNVRDIITALQYLHQHNCAHLALQHDNILVSQDNNIKLNNYEINRTNPYKDNDQTTDLNKLGQTLYQLLGGNNTLPTTKHTEINHYLPPNIGEVYGVIIQKCHNIDTETNNTSFDSLNDLLNNYERNKRFGNVLALHENQFFSRYTFDPDTDKITQTDQSISYKAHDNLLDTNTELDIFILNEPLNNASILANLQQKQYAHVLKVILNNNDNNTQIALVGIAQTNNNTQKTTEPTYNNTLIAIATDNPNTQTNDTDNQNSTIDNDLQNEFSTENPNNAAEVRDSTGIAIEMVDEQLALELAALDAEINQIAHKQSPIQNEKENILAVNETIAEVAENPFANDNFTDTNETDNNAPLNLNIPELPEEEALKGTEMIQNEALEQVLRDFRLRQIAENVENTSDDIKPILPNSPTTSINDDQDFVWIDSPELPEEEALKGTEMIQNEALEQVLRDFRLQQGETLTSTKQTELSETSSELAQTNMDDDGDIVNINTPDLPENEAIKGTEIIQHEAIEQVLRDMERFLKNK